MITSKRIKEIFFNRFAQVIRKAHFFGPYNFQSDNRPTAPFKLVFFCGKSGIDYLNASLYSVYQNWEFLPEVLIVSDGTPLSIFKKKVVKWPKTLSIVSWKQCAEFYKNKKNNDLYLYALKEVWGKKFAAVLYCSEHFPTLYSDTDVLWYSSPKVNDFLEKPFLKMAQDVEMCYSVKMLKRLQQEDCLENLPLNAGVIYANGDFSTFASWGLLCKYLAADPDDRTEQTAFAILNNYFNGKEVWKEYEILIKVDDTYSLNYTNTKYPNITARHYVNTKHIAFWRDFTYMRLKKKIIIFNS